jgi:hypothetical protein
MVTFLLCVCTVYTLLLHSPKLKFYWGHHLVAVGVFPLSAGLPLANCKWENLELGISEFVSTKDKLYGVLLLVLYLFTSFRV